MLSDTFYIPPFLSVAEARLLGCDPITVPKLRARDPAWTEGTIAKILGAPDAVMHNTNGGRKRVYFLQRVIAAEATPEFARRSSRLNLKWLQSAPRPLSSIRQHD